MKSASSQLHVVGGQDGVEERHVRGVGRDAGVEQRVVGQLAVGPDPQALVGLAGALASARAARRCGAGRSGGAGRTSRPAPPARARAARTSGGERLGVGHVGHGELVLEALLEVVERRRQVEDGPPVLDGHHPPGGEGPPVADAVDLVEDRDVRVAGAQEVRRAASGRGPCSTVRPAAIRACPATWPPKTRWRSSLGWVPRKMLTSIGSRSSRWTRNSRDALIGPCSQAVEAPRPAHAAAGATTLRRHDHASPQGAGRELVFPDGLHLGRGHGRPPDRGRQRQQRLVGLGAQPRLGHAGAERRRLRLVPPLARGRRPGGRHRPGRLPLLARVEPDRAGRGRVLDWPPSSTTGASAPPATGRASRPVVTFHHFTTPRWLAARGRLGGARRARALRPLRHPGHRPPR